MSNNQYTDQQINDFLELAQEIGIGRAQRKLGYPSSWSTANRWAKARGIEVAVDELKARSKEFHDWYTTEEVLLVAQEGFYRVYEELIHNANLTADEQKKLAEALTKHYNVWANAQGKATNISETRQTDTMDEHLAELLSMERAKNTLKSTSDRMSVSNTDGLTKDDDKDGK